MESIKDYICYWNQSSVTRKAASMSAKTDIYSNMICIGGKSPFMYQAQRLFLGICIIHFNFLTQKTWKKNNWHILKIWFQLSRHLFKMVRILIILTWNHLSHGFWHMIFWVQLTALAPIFSWQNMTTRMIQRLWWLICGILIASYRSTMTGQQCTQCSILSICLIMTLSKERIEDDGMKCRRPFLMIYICLLMNLFNQKKLMLLTFLQNWINSYGNGIWRIYQYRVSRTISNGNLAIGGLG